MHHQTVETINYLEFISDWPILDMGINCINHTVKPTLKLILTLYERVKIGSTPVYQVFTTVISNLGLQEHQLMDSWATGSNRRA